VAAWNDEAHVRDNRRQYAEKFAAVTPLLADVLDATMPDASFYLWVRTPKNMSDTDFARRLLADYNVLLVPGNYLAREAQGVNPGAGFVRIALVAPLADCVEAANRIRSFISKL
jgi:N-succinyldiaminopimelate aminotransferase